MVLRRVIFSVLVGGDVLRQALEAVVQLIEALDNLLHLGRLRSHLLEIRVVAIDDVRHHAVMDLVVGLHLLLRHCLLLDGGGDAAGEEEAQEGGDPEPVVERDHVSKRTHFLLSLSLGKPFSARRRLPSMQKNALFVDVQSNPNLYNYSTIYRHLSIYKKVHKNNSPGCAFAHSGAFPFRQSWE